MDHRDEPFVGDRLFGGLQVGLALWSIVFIFGKGDEVTRGVPREAADLGILLALVVLAASVVVGIGIWNSMKWAMVTMLVVGTLACLGTMAKPEPFNVLFIVAGFVYSLLRVLGTVGPPLR